VSHTDPDPQKKRRLPDVPSEGQTIASGADLPKIPGITLHFELARGGMGVVYSGRQDFLDRRVAVKLLAVELGGESFVQRFQREAKILAGIKHPNIVSCHLAGQTDGGQSYLVMEFIDGPSLKKWIADHGPLPVPAALRLTRAVAQALAHAHSLGIIHRDVKAENILLETVTSTALDIAFPYTPKVVDLGLARASEGNASMGLTSPGSVMGTPATMSPEQFDDPDAVDFRTDIYGLGCVLFEMLVGKPAYDAKKLTAGDRCAGAADAGDAARASARVLQRTRRTAARGDHESRQPAGNAAQGAGVIRPNYDGRRAGDGEDARRRAREVVVDSAAAAREQRSGLAAHGRDQLPGRRARRAGGAGGSAGVPGRRREQAAWHEHRLDRLR
jgi:tRNA A-37 threonylcarbamoyl transferase component Bud32